MPELPEVETVARGLQISVAGRRILSVTLRKTDFIDDPGAIARELPGRTIAKVERFGKFMLLRLIPSANTSQPGEGAASPSSQALLVHLGMTGNLAPHVSAAPLEKRTQVIFPFDDGRQLRFSGAWRF